MSKARAIEAGRGRPGAGKAAVLRDRVGRATRWRLRRLRPQLRRPLVNRRHRELESADAVLASYPRSGSNWMAQMLAELLTGSEVDFQTRPYPVPFVNELHAEPATPRPLPGGGRLVKTHEQFRPEYRRAVYMVRHPGDVAVSYFRQMAWWGLPSMEFNRFFDAWIAGEIDGYGTWAENVEAWLDAPVPVEVVRFEDLKADTDSKLDRSMRFLGLEPDCEAIGRAIENNSIGRMREKLEKARSEVVFVGLAENALPMSRGGSAEWADVLAPEQVDALLGSFGPVIERCGYEGPH